VLNYSPGRLMPLVTVEVRRVPAMAVLNRYYPIDHSTARDSVWQ
jgi:hypothetical protein